MGYYRNPPGPGSYPTTASLAVSQWALAPIQCAIPFRRWMGYQHQLRTTSEKDPSREEPPRLSTKTKFAHSGRPWSARDVHESYRVPAMSTNNSCAPETAIVWSTLAPESSGKHGTAHDGELTLVPCPQACVPFLKVFTAHHPRFMKCGEAFYCVERWHPVVSQRPQPLGSLLNRAPSRCELKGAPEPRPDTVTANVRTLPTNPLQRASYSVCANHARMAAGVRQREVSVCSVSCVSPLLLPP
jgi:hypothetical protein